MKTKTVGVVGLGLLGRGIAACLLAHGFKVIGYTRGDASHEEARLYIQRAIGDLIERAGFSPSLRESWPLNYVPVHTLDSFGPCDFVIESVIEDLAVKEQVFDELESVVRPEVPIASNTSSLPISQLQSHRRHPGRFLGMHWAEPSHVTRFMELIRGEQTGDAAFTAATQLARRLGKEPSLVQKDVPAFIVNRLGYAMYREAIHILEMGVADMETIDRAFRNACGLWATICGPFRWIDITGGPAVYGRAMQRLLPSLANSTALPAVLQKMIDENAKGTINGHGFYSYTREEAEQWEALFLKHAWKVRELLNGYFPLTSPEEERGTQSMQNPDNLLSDLGYPLERITPEGELVEAVAVVRQILYASGQVAFDGDKLVSKGKVPSQVGLEAATEAAALCAANVLRSVRKHLGSLDRVERVVRVTGYVNADPDFTDEHLVINGASQLVQKVFGEAGRHARTSVGVAQLPLGSSVEVEMILEIKAN